MVLDFSQLPMRKTAFSKRPATFLDDEPRQLLSTIIDQIAIETGDRAAREHWQQQQLENLILHATQRSEFWRKRVAGRKIDGIDIRRLPPLTRQELIAQVKSEGALLKENSPNRVAQHSTSGSTGTPVAFFVSHMNAYMNNARSLAQTFVENRDLSPNKIRTRGVPTLKSKNGFSVETANSWLGSLGQVFRSGTNRHIQYFHPDISALCEEMRRGSIGYLVAQPRLVESILQVKGPGFFKDADTFMYIPLADVANAELRETFASLGIPVRANYSCEETGLLGFECAKTPEHYHVATSNVLIEVVPENPPQRFNDQDVGRVLITYLHSYATPFIRYEVGDLATLHQKCPCGHDGPTLSNLHGREKSLLRLPDGTLKIFFIRGKEFAASARMDEYRIRQTALDKIVVEIGGRDSLTPKEESALVDLIKLHAGDVFNVEVIATPAIDWGRSVKRLGFKSEVL
jgi:phenylacetate-coenzyme A ligase PaaK-like adenylate-forming protein